MDNRKCSFENCPNDGEFKAPSSPKELKRYVWFCLKHIREYNKKWNYFSDMSADEIEEFIENDIIGHRKTKKIGTNDVNYFEKISKISEQMFSGMNNLENLNMHPSFYSSKYLNALATLGMDKKESSLEDIKSKFKKIVKELHNTAPQQLYDYLLHHLPYDISMQVRHAITHSVLPDLER